MDDNMMNPAAEPEVTETPAEGVEVEAAPAEGEAAA